MICKKYDTPNDDDAKYCMHCGADLGRTEEPESKKKGSIQILWVSDSSRSSVGSYRIVERNIRHQDIRIPVCEES